MLEYGMTFELEDVKASVQSLSMHWKSAEAKHEATEARHKATEARLQAAEAKLQAAEAKLQAAYTLWPSWRPP